MALASLMNHARVHVCSTYCDLACAAIAYFLQPCAPPFRCSSPFVAHFVSICIIQPLSSFMTHFVSICTIQPPSAMQAKVVQSHVINSCCFSCLYLQPHEINSCCFSRLRLQPHVINPCCFSRLCLHPHGINSCCLSRLCLHVINC
jgi:hypothetical protein